MRNRGRFTDGVPVEIFNGRGSFLAKAVVTDRTRPGVVSAPSIWWNKLVPGGRNANSTTRKKSPTSAAGPRSTTIWWMCG